MNKKRIGMTAGTILLLIILLLFGPLDLFTHGYFPDEIDVGQIAEADRIGSIPVDDENCVISFTPQKRHFAGFELYLIHQVPENSGFLNVSIHNSLGEELDTAVIDLTKAADSVWYKVYTKAALKKGETYTLTFEVSKGADVPSFMLVHEDYLPDEYTSGNILICFAYSQSTFSFQEKVMISMGLLAFWCLAVYALTDRQSRKYGWKTTAYFLLLTALLSWNYMYNSMDNQNGGFAGFQADSETLATGTIYAERDGIYFLSEGEQGYGLGRYSNLKGILNIYGLDYLTDENWLNGYGRTQPQIIVNANAITRKIAAAGNYIQFKNGEEYQIAEITDDGNNIVLTLHADRTLCQARNGSLDDTVFFDASHQPMAKSMITAYGSQYGLQGKVFRHMARYMEDEEAITNLNFICALSTAAVFAFLVLLLAVKWNRLFAGCFYLTFLLSPWIVNFARNLYWVEFTWFLPMAVGLICALKISDRKWRMGCYAAAFITITGKCLCGYEYISVIMMGLVSFLTIDLLCAIMQKDQETARLLFRTTFLMGIAALAGFLAAICIHAPLRGDGSILQGIQNIIQYDVLRRTNGADLNDFSSNLWPSLNASVWEVYCTYFHFHTEVITGITGNLFPLLCITPLAVFVYEYKNKQPDVAAIVMYLFFFATSISWFCFAKSHSYIHTHMNYVLWYFGFVQTCLYIIVSRIRNALCAEKKAAYIQAPQIQQKGKRKNK